MHSNNFQLEVWREFGNSEDIELYVYFNRVKFYEWDFTLKGVDAVMKKTKLLMRVPEGSISGQRTLL